MTPGEESKVEIIRNGESQIITMIVGDLDVARGEQVGSVAEPIENPLGLAVTELSAAQKLASSLEFGLVVEEVTGEVATEAGFQEGDILLSLNGQTLDSVDEFATIVSELPTERALPVLVARGGSQAFFTIRIPE